MIIVKLMGGLGNQMFQYALGRRLAYEHSTFPQVGCYPGLRRKHCDLINWIH